MHATAKMLRVGLLSFLAAALPLDLTPAPAPGPNGYACQPDQTKSLGLPFCNVSLSVQDRVQDLLKRLTLEEAVGLLHAK